MNVSYQIGADRVTVSAEAENALLDALRALDDRFATNAIDFLEASADNGQDLGAMLASAEVAAIAQAAAATPARVHHELGQLVAVIQGAVVGSG